MREVIVSDTVWSEIAGIKNYLIYELKLSEKSADIRINRMGVFLYSLGNYADYALCRFKRWRKLGYRCAVFEKDWIFAYETFDEGVIVRDMSHTKLLKE